MPTLKTPSDSLSVQQRDLALFRGLFESRVMTADHISTLYFGAKSEATKKRLQKLKAAELIDERPRRPYEPSVLFLARKGYDILRDQGVLSEYPYIGRSSIERRSRVSDLTLRHELEVMDVKTAFHSAINGTDAFTVAEFSTWPLLHQFEVSRPERHRPELVKPDGFIRIREKEADGGVSEHSFFLEVDRSSEIQDTLVARAGCYLKYYNSGGFAAKHGAPRAAYKEYPFRVLLVFKTAERRNNIAERLLQSNPPIYAQACLATFAEATADPLGAVWTCPRDYHDATKGTPFDPDRRRKRWGYQRQAAREELVDQRIRKFRILTAANTP